MTKGDIQAEIYQDDDSAPRRLALFEDGQLVDYFEAQKGSEFHLGAIIAARITRIFTSQRRAECQLPNGTLASFRLGAKPYPKAGDIRLITLTAEPRQHKPWQAEQGISRAGRYIILHYGQDDVRLSYKAQSGKIDVPEQIATSIKDMLPKGWGAVIRRHLFDSLVRDDDLDNITHIIQAEITALLAPLGESLLFDNSRLIEPKTLYQGDDLMLAGRLAAHASPRSVIEKNDSFWNEVADEIDKIYSEQVTLETGVVFTVEKTQALTAIDIDSGASQLGPKELARQTAKPLMRLIRLARLSGIVMVDMPRLPFADQDSVLSILRDEARRDRRSPAILGFSRAGLIEIVIRHHYAPLR